MKALLKWLPCLCIIIFISVITYSYAVRTKQIREFRETQSTLLDSVGKMNMEKHYMMQLIELNQNDHHTVLSDTVSAYEIHDNKRQLPLKMEALMSSGKKKLIIRYTEIGCNACADSTFKFLRRDSSLLQKYDVMVLVDFSDFEYYVKWRKIAEVNERVLWLGRGSLPFPAESKKLSYLFVIDSSLKASSFFIPDSRFVPYLNEYLRNL